MLLLPCSFGVMSSRVGVYEAFSSAPLLLRNASIGATPGRSSPSQPKKSIVPDGVGASPDAAAVVVEPPLSSLPHAASTPGSASPANAPAL